MHTIAEVIEGLNLTFDAIAIDKRPDGLMADMPTGSQHFKIKMRCGRDRMQVYWTQGPAIRENPTLEHVLDTIASDAASVDNAQDFAEWAFDLGYTTSADLLRKGRRIYGACVRQARSLKKLLGDSVYQALLWDCERL